MIRSVFLTVMTPSKFSGVKSILSPKHIACKYTGQQHPFHYTTINLSSSNILRDEIQLHYYIVVHIE